MDENTVENETSGQDKHFSEYLTFMLGNDIYGVPVKIVKEVNRYGKVFPVPKSPVCVKGIINLRGDVIPVIDLNTRLFNTESRITALTNIIILETEAENEITQTGIIIDSVKEVVNIADEDIEIPPAFALNIRKDFAKGVGKTSSGFAIVLDIPSVLNVDEISEIVSAAENPEAAFAYPPIPPASPNPRNPANIADPKNSTNSSGESSESSESGEMKQEG